MSVRMGGSGDVARRLAGAMMAVGLVMGAAAGPGAAYAEQAGSGETSVFVTMERFEKEQEPDVQSGNFEEVVEIGPRAASPAGLLPQTGDSLGSRVLCGSLAWVAALSLCAAGRARRRSFREDG